MGATSPSPAGAAPVPLALSMVPGRGELLIDDAEEPFLLESPTTVIGTYDDGLGTLTGADLSTPPFSFEAPVLGGALTAEVDATFTQIGSGTTTGQLSPDGAFTLDSSLRVDLHIEVPAVGISAACVVSPVQLSMVSQEPYSTVTGQVTIADADFTIPPAQVGPGCPDTVASPLNELLAGPGHSLTLTLEGAMTVPMGGTVVSITDLTATPEGGAAVGEEVTLAATIASGNPEITDVPTGTVTFRDGATTLGQVNVVGGVATLTSTRLRLGQRSITARYNGDPTYLPSTSGLTDYLISATPTVNADLPTNMSIGAPPAEFTVVTENPSVGSAVVNARVDVTISRFAPSGFSSDALTPDDVVIEVETSPGTWTPVTLTQVPATTPTLAGSLGVATGRPLAVGQTFEDGVRLSFPSGNPETIPSPLDIELAVVEVDPGTGTIGRELVSTTGRVNLVLPGRVDSHLTFFDFDSDAYGPQTIRQEGTLAMSNVQVGPALGGTRPSGTISVLIDGHPVPAFGGTMLLTDPPAAAIPLSPDCGCTSPLLVDLPSSVGVGNHVMTISYSGDSQFRPSTTSVAFTVVPRVSRPYRCLMDVFASPRRFNVQVDTFGRLPAAVTAGSTLSLSDFSFRILPDRNQAEYLSFSLLVGEFATFQGLTLDFGPGGSGGATTATIDPATFEFGPGLEDDPDFVVDFGDETMSLAVTGAPGSTIAPKLEGFSLSSDVFGSQLEMTCEAADEPFAYGSVMVAGTTLTVDAHSPARADDEVTLTASVFPRTGSGTVRFYDGDTLLDIAAVADGRAVSTVTLPAGEHSLAARFFGGLSAPSTTSMPVALTVRAATECDGFAEVGNGAVVRLVYMELLRRCPDQAGFDHWVGRLDGGTSPEVFARTIARTPEAVGVVVNGGYQTMLGRDADVAGRTFWTGRLQGHGRYDQLLADLAASDEFWTKAGSTNEGFVTRVYGRLLNRAPDQGGLDYWAARLDRGTSRRALVVTLANLDEPLGVLVVQSYDEILSRTPSSGERAAGITHLRATGDRSGFYAQLIGRPEFTQRAQSFPNPED